MLNIIIVVVAKILGSAFLKKLLKNDKYKVIVIENLFTGKKYKLPSQIWKINEKEKITTIDKVILKLIKLWKKLNKCWYQL